jgi:hypothetical protein
MRWLLLLGLLALAGPARPEPVSGQPVSGQHDPRFEAALATWLADDEAGSLPGIAALAAEDNRAAQLLLALIDRVPVTQGPWLARLSRAERLALLRAPGGLSGRSWMAVAAPSTPLAALWIERDATDAGPGTALAFAGMGEARAARATLQALASRQHRGFAAVADDPRYPPDLRHLVWREWATTPEGEARAEAEITRLMPGDPQIRRFDDRPVAAAATDAWLAAAPLAAPLRATCAAACPDDPAPCRGAAYLLVGGHGGLAEFGTPSETLIPADTWDASPRGRRALLRAPDARGRFAYQTAETVRARSACLADALAAEVARFHQ